jgi:hypothetical protein
MYLSLGPRFISKNQRFSTQGCHFLAEVVPCVDELIGLNVRIYGRPKRFEEESPVFFVKAIFFICRYLCYISGVAKIEQAGRCDFLKRSKYLELVCFFSFCEKASQSVM